MKNQKNQRKYRQSFEFMQRATERPREGGAIVGVGNAWLAAELWIREEKAKMEEESKETHGQ